MFWYELQRVQLNFIYILRSYLSYVVSCLVVFFRNSKLFKISNHNCFAYLFKSFNYCIVVRWICLVKYHLVWCSFLYILDSFIFVAICVSFVQTDAMPLNKKDNLPFEQFSSNGKWCICFSPACSSSYIIWNTIWLAWARNSRNGSSKLWLLKLLNRWVSKPISSLEHRKQGNLLRLQLKQQWSPLNPNQRTISEAIHFPTNSVASRRKRPFK